MLELPDEDRQSAIEMLHVKWCQHTAKSKTSLAYYYTAETCLSKSISSNTELVNGLRLKVQKKYLFVKVLTQQSVH